jgi:hypothetical protein
VIALKVSLQLFEKRLLRGRLHVYESVYESPYNSAHNLLRKDLGIVFSIRHPLQPFVNTFQQKIDPKFDCNPPLAPNRTPNRTRIRTRICKCRRTLTKIVSVSVCTPSVVESRLVVCCRRHRGRDQLRGRRRRRYELGRDSPIVKHYS